MNIDLVKNHFDNGEFTTGGKGSDPAIKYLDVSDQKIWDDFKQGDESAFIHIYSTYFRELISFGYQFCHEKELVEDCVQDLFVDLRRKRNNLSSIRSSIKLYLFQALKRRITDYQVKLKKAPWFEFLEENGFNVILPHEAHIINEQIYNEKIEKLNSAIKKLTTRQREALYYLFFKCLTYEEIKVLMKLDNIKSARNLIYKAIASLKPYIETSTLVLFLLIKMFVS